MFRGTLQNVSSEADRIGLAGHEQKSRADLSCERAEYLAIGCLQECSIDYDVQSGSQAVFGAVGQTAVGTVTELRRIHALLDARRRGLQGADACEALALQVRTYADSPHLGNQALAHPGFSGAGGTVHQDQRRLPRSRPTGGGTNAVLQSSAQFSLPGR